LLALATAQSKIMRPFADKLIGMKRDLILIFMFLVVCGCAKHNLDRDIVGIWRNVSQPTSATMEMEARTKWHAQLVFREDKTFEWTILSEGQKPQSWAGAYEVDGLGVTLTLKTREGEPLTESQNVGAYTVRLKQDRLSFPLPTDWTGPTVDYTKSKVN
jgi:hypothetical protein